MRRICWIASGVVAAACGRSPLIVTGGDTGEDGANGDERGAPPDGNDGRPLDDDDGADDGSFVDEPGPDVPSDTPPDPSCGNGKIDPGELCYLPHVGYPSRIDPCALAIADLNNDGHLDVAVPNSDFGHLEAPENYASILLGDGAGRLGDPIPFLAGGDYAVGISIGDVDNDGMQDLIVANNDAGTINVLRAMTPGVYGAPSEHAAGVSPVMTAVADIDGDGDVDVATTGNGSSEVIVRVSRGDGTFAPSRSYAIDGPWEVVLADFSGDGLADMAATDSYANQVIVWLGGGDGTFTTSGALATGGVPYGLVAVDLDENGRLDLVTANREGSISVFVTDADWNLQRLDDVSVGAAPHSIASGDFDMDGRVDVAAADDALNVVHVVLGNGKGEFEPAALYSVGAKPSNLRVGDLNEDGVLDLVTSDQLSNTVGVLLSNP